MFRKLFQTNKYAKVDEELMTQIADGAQIMGITKANARRSAMELFSSTKLELINQGLSLEDIYLEGNGDRLLEMAKSDPTYRTQVEDLYAHGVTDNDIREWHNQSNIQKYVLLNTDKTVMMAEIRTLISKGFTQDEAVSQVLGHHATFTDDTSQIKDEDSFLPQELKLRVMRYRNQKLFEGPAKFRKEVATFSSFNAFVRDKLRTGSLS